MHTFRRQLVTTWDIACWFHKELRVVRCHCNIQAHSLRLPAIMFIGSQQVYLHLAHTYIAPSPAYLHQAEEACAEMLQMLGEFLPREYPGYFQKQGNTLTALKTHETFQIGGGTMDPLEACARIVQASIGQHPHLSMSTCACACACACAFACACACACLCTCGKVSWSKLEQKHIGLGQF